MGFEENSLREEKNTCFFLSCLKAQHSANTSNHLSCEQCAYVTLHLFFLANVAISAYLDTHLSLLELMGSFSIDFSIFLSRFQMFS